MTRSYITQIESGRTRCRRDFALRLDRALKSGTTVIDAWDELLESIKSVKYPDYFVNFPKAEQSASMLPFVIATLPDQRQVVYTDNAYGGETTTFVQHVTRVSETFVMLQAEALNAGDARRLIGKVIEERWT